MHEMTLELARAVFKKQKLALVKLEKATDQKNGASLCMKNVSMSQTVRYLLNSLQFFNYP